MVRKFLLSFLVLVAVTVNCFAKDDEQPKLGKTAPLFELASSKNDTVALANLRGEFVIIHFAASW